MRQPEKGGSPWIQEQLLGLVENINSVCQNRTPELWRIENTNPLAECGTEDLLGDFLLFMAGAVVSLSLHGNERNNFKAFVKVDFNKGRCCFDTLPVI